MKRLVMLFAGLMVAALVAGGATAAGVGSPQVTLTTSTGTLAPIDTLTLHGAYTIGTPVVGGHVTVTQYDTPACPVPSTAHVAKTYSTTTGPLGLYSITVNGLAAGKHSFLTTATQGYHPATSSCLTVTVVAPVPAPQLTLTNSSGTLGSIGALTLHGAYTIGTPVVGGHVTVSQYDTPTCPVPTTAHVAKTYSATTGLYGLYAIAVNGLAIGKHSFLATATWQGNHPATSSCLMVTIVTPPPDQPVVPEPPVVPEQPVVPVAPLNPPSSYLCWNNDMVNPVAYEDAVADGMWTSGKYFEPKAVLGNVAGGTNIGAYHLICNAPSALQATGDALGGSGEVYSAAAMTAYHVDHPVNGNDLNVYPIYK